VSLNGWASGEAETRMTEQTPDVGQREATGALSDLLMTPCDCDEAWTGRGRHASACRWRFIHDFLDDDEIAAILARLAAIPEPVASELVSG
jgi:hypothetical protein